MEEIIRRYNARILEITREYVILEKTGHQEETEALFNELEKYDISQFVRSGRVAVTKSPRELLSMYLEEQELRKSRSSQCQE